jgi:aryl-alcohol dehydrogenase-like predicted oxidoreductase
MRYRDLGASGLRVSEIGFGAWGIGGRTPGATSYGETDDATSCAALERAFELGIRFFDTSSVYGYGHSEALIGRAFAGRRADVVIATKAGFVDYQRAPDHSPAAIRRSLEGSLQRLATDYVDLLQLHNPPAQGPLDATVRELERLRAEGKLRAFGVSVKSPEEALALVAAHPFDAVQANFNMLDLRAEHCGLLARLREKRIGFIARTPLSFGFLSGALTPQSTFPPEDHRSRWSAEQIRRWAEGAREVLDGCAEARREPAFRVALRFCLSHDAVSCTIPGILTPREAEDDAAASEAGPLSAASLAHVRRVNEERDFLAS